MPLLPGLINLKFKILELKIEEMRSVMYEHAFPNFSSQHVALKSVWLQIWCIISDEDIYKSLETENAHNITVYGTACIHLIEAAKEIARLLSLSKQHPINIDSDITKCCIALANAGFFLKNYKRRNLEYIDLEDTENNRNKFWIEWEMTD